MHWMTDTEYLHQLIARARSFYNSIGEIFCPVLNEWVVFNSRGFRHIMKDGSGRTRNVLDQIRRLKLLPLSIPTITYARRIEGCRQTYAENTATTYISLVYSAGKNRDVKVRVILKQTGDGPYIFWSIMHA